ncbi:MAG TPA: serine hydrolase [Puia sp.]|nr:serine hydrolase [Puia sp.]
MSKLSGPALLLFFCLCAITHPLSAQQPSAKQAISNLERDIPSLLQQADVPGLSIALIHDGKIVWTGAFGIANAKTKKPVTKTTVFEAASLSKPVFAYGVLKLVDKGMLNLDTPLNKYLGNNYDVVGDDRINLITARHILSHTSGFPNWRGNDDSKDLRIHFTPGSKWSYSGEGMVYLSKVVEKITGIALEDYMQLEVLRPLGMTSSSYIWQDRYDTLKAWRHDILGEFTGRNQPKDLHTTRAQDSRDTTGASQPHTPVHETGNAAASLVTNAEDYARFIIAIMDGKGLTRSTWEQMLTPQVRVTPKYPPIAWGLGWGLETMDEGKYFWHWGDNGDAKAYITALLPKKDAVVYFADGSNGLAFTKEILADALGGGDHPAVNNLNYERYNSPARLLLKSILAQGATPALSEYKQRRLQDTLQRINEESMNTMGYTLMGKQHLKDAIEVFKQNTEDFPNSWNVWDSLAEAYANDGEKDLAIKNYERSVQLNPDNKNGARKLEKLKQ